jgi:hypothetical protein
LAGDGGAQEEGGAATIGLIRAQGGTLLEAASSAECTVVGPGANRALFPRQGSAGDCVVLFSWAENIRARTDHVFLEYNGLHPISVSETIPFSFFRTFQIQTSSSPSAAARNEPMAVNPLASPAAGRTPNHKTAPSPSPSTRRAAADAATAAATAAAVESKARFEAYNRLQAAAVTFGEKLPIPEIVAIGGQSDGKSSLLEALLGFRFNVREVEMGTRRPLVLQMVHDPTALEPRCRFQVRVL